MLLDAMVNGLYVTVHRILAVSSDLSANFQKSCKRPCTGSLVKMTRKEFSIFIIFSDTYTCTYVV